MSADVQTFLANFQGGGLRPNRYEVILTFPASVPDAISSALKAGFTIKATSIPSSNLGVISLPYKGREVKVPGDKTFDDWNVTVMLDNDLVTRKIFEKWHNAILGFSTNVAEDQMVNPLNTYASATVRLLDRADKLIDTYQVESIFPTQVGEVTLGWDQNDQVAEQQITFAINGWTSSAIA